MNLQELEIKKVLVDYPNQKISINDGQIILRPNIANSEKIMLMAYFVAHSTKYPPISNKVKGFTWKWAIENFSPFPYNPFI